MVVYKKVDFTISKYHELLDTLLKSGYRFISCAGYFSLGLEGKKQMERKDKWIILRHDVDELPENALEFARMQASLGIKGTYYFRIVRKSFNVQIIREIHKLGHEIGYHYETLDACNGDIDKAYQMFCENLKTFRDIVPIETICMHGSPLSKFDNREIWKHYDYKKLGLIAEPYFDLDFNTVFYITDTGRSWNSKANIRDKSLYESENMIRKFDGLSFSSTGQIIKAIKSNRFPELSMFTFHPQRWHSRTVLWLKELGFQKIKNVVKLIIGHLNKH